MHNHIIHESNDWRPHARIVPTHSQPPVRAMPWTDERQLVRDGPICIQRDPYRRDQEISGSEDCLYLNVYVPLTPAADTATGSSLPVMVFFHGGGFQCGSGIGAFYGPDHMLDEDVIYVGANYRLGPLGFLSTENAAATGNFGLKDQVMVLEWIRDHIGRFGGDAGRVTIFGESAGGASVTYHMMSPLSKGMCMLAWVLTIVCVFDHNEAQRPLFDDVSLQVFSSRPFRSRVRIWPPGRDLPTRAWRPVERKSSAKSSDVLEVEATRPASRRSSSVSEQSMQPKSRRRFTISS